MDDLLSIAVSNAVAATVLAVAAIAVGAVYRRPALVHGLWLLVLLKLVTPPLLFIPVAWPAAAEMPAEVAVIQEEPTIAPAGGSSEARPTLQLPEQPAAAAEQPAGEDEFVGEEAPPIAEEAAIPVPVVLPETPLWPEILRIVWAVGALAWFVLVLERLHHFRRLLRFARPAPAALQERTRRLAGALGLKNCPRVRLLPGRIAPMLWAVGGPPRLLVPADLIAVLSDEQLDTLLVHELAHLRRRDHWLRVLEFVVMGLYWWHPVVWYARRELREAEEQCCDAWVVSTLPNTGRTYASALLDTLDFLSTTQAAVPPLASGLGQIADLKRRLTMIMQGNTPRSLTWPGCLAVVTLGLTFLPMLPSLRGEPPRKEEAREEIREAEKELEKAKEALEREKNELNQKVKEIIKAQQRLANESVRKARAQLEKDHAQARLGRDEEKVTIRVVITASPDARAVDVKEIVRQIQKALPEHLRSKIEFGDNPPAPAVQLQMRMGQNPPPPGPAMPGQPAYQGQPPAFVPRLPAVQRGNVIGGPSPASEKRINDLEKKLEKVLREVQELRKQMKQPRGGNRSIPAPAAPPPEEPPAPPGAPLAPPAPPGTFAPQPRFKLVPSHTPPRAPGNPYYAPTAPLAPSPEPGR